MQINEVMKRVHTLEVDHDADGWPAVRMRDLTMLRDAGFVQPSAEVDRASGSGRTQS